MADSPTPWWVRGGTIFDANGDRVLFGPYPMCAADCVRIVACVNALAGVPLSRIEAVTSVNFCLVLSEAGD